MGRSFLCPGSVRLPTPTAAPAVVLLLPLLGRVLPLARVPGLLRVPLIDLPVRGRGRGRFLVDRGDRFLLVHGSSPVRIPRLALPLQLQLARRECRDGILSAARLPARAVSFV